MKIFDKFCFALYVMVFTSCLWMGYTFNFYGENKEGLRFIFLAIGYAMIIGLIIYPIMDHFIKAHVNRNQEESKN